MGDSDAASMGEKDIRRPEFSPLQPPGSFDATPNFASSDYAGESPRHTQSQHLSRSQTFASIPSTTGGHDTASHAAGTANGIPEANEEIAWGPSHPCFPHMNTHVPLDSEEFVHTRIIRVRRDWMIRGDLAPTFSNLYPEILDPLLPEQEFRSLIARINEDLIASFSPYKARNWIDGIIGFLTGWIWDDFGGNRVKSRIKSMEAWLEHWNQTVGVEEGVKIWDPRRTGYLSLDIQIPDPKIGIDSEAASAENLHPSTTGLVDSEMFSPQLGN